MLGEKEHCFVTGLLDLRVDSVSSLLRYLHIFLKNSDDVYGQEAGLGKISRNLKSMTGKVDEAQNDGVNQKDYRHCI